MVRGICLIILLALCSLQTIAQVDAFATVKLNRTEVYPEQPIKATITVSTATWFTAPLTFENLQVENAFVIPFKRTLSTQIERNGKTYPSLQFYYLIYPYKSGSYKIPELVIQIESPAVGDYKGVATTLKTRSVSFTVNKPPNSFDAPWFIATNVTIQEQWDDDIEQVKVGDVMLRELTINAAGTLPSFIPPTNFNDVNAVSIYERSPTLNDKRNNQTANGERIDRAVYLFEKEGEVEIPEVRIDWWNPYQQKAYFKRIPARTITVLPNPDLGMIASVRDSLNVIGGLNEPTTESANRRILGLKTWQFLSVLIVAIIALIKAYQFIKVQIKDIRERRRAFLQSEEYYFQQILRYKGDDPEEILKRVYRWWDAFRVPFGIEGSLTEQLVDEELKTHWEDVLEKRKNLDYADYREMWKRFRSDFSYKNADTIKHFSILQSV